MVTAHLGGRRSKPVILRYVGEQRRGRGRIFLLETGEHQVEVYVPNGHGPPRFWDRKEGRELR